MHGVAIVSKLPIEAARDARPLPPRPCALRRRERCRLRGAEPLRARRRRHPRPRAEREVRPQARLRRTHARASISPRAQKRSALPLLVAGDINIAPEENDVWSHRQLLNVVSHTPVETDGLKRVLARRQAHRHRPRQTQAGEKLYTWWSYRAADWKVSNRGRRLDHWWADKRATPLVDIASYQIHPEERGGEKPSRPRARHHQRDSGDLIANATYSLSSRKREALSGTHFSTPTASRCFPALAALGRDDKSVVSRS
jgi:exodeoxyribonuclease-3